MRIDQPNKESGGEWKRPKLVTRDGLSFSLPIKTMGMLQWKNKSRLDGIYMNVDKIGTHFENDFKCYWLFLGTVAERRRADVHPGFYCRF